MQVWASLRFSSHKTLDNSLTPPLRLIDSFSLYSLSLAQMHMHREPGLCELSALKKEKRKWRREHMITVSKQHT